MNRVKITISDESGKSLCKVGTSIAPAKGYEYNDKEIADALAETATMLYAAWDQRKVMEAGQ